MERIKTLCVFIYLSGLVAAIPFPEPYTEGYNAGYEQPQQRQYNNFEQPQPLFGQLQQNGRSGLSNPSPRPSPTYSRDIYAHNPSNTVQNPVYDGFVNQEPAIQQRQNFESYLPPPALNSQQIQQQIQEQIKEQQEINERLVHQNQNQVRAQNVRTAQVPQSSIPETNIPVMNSYQQNNVYQEATSSPHALIYGQELPREQVPNPEQWNRAPGTEYRNGPVRIETQTTDGYTFGISGPQEQNPYQQIYHHLVRQQKHSPGGPTHEVWQNLWKKYSGSQALPEQKKRYLVIYPDGRTEYVDKLDTIVKQHSNYLLMNNGAGTPSQFSSRPPSPVNAPLPANPNQNPAPSSISGFQALPTQSQLVPLPFNAQPSALFSSSGTPPEPLSATGASNTDSSNESPESLNNSSSNISASNTSSSNTGTSNKGISNTDTLSKGESSTSSINTELSITEFSNTDASNTSAANTSSSTSSDSKALSTSSLNTSAPNTGSSNTDDSNTDASNTDGSNTSSHNTKISKTSSSNTSESDTKSLNTAVSNASESDAESLNTGDSSKSSSNTSSSNTSSSITRAPNTGSPDTGTSNTSSSNTDSSNTRESDEESFNTGVSNSRESDLESSNTGATNVSGSDTESRNTDASNIGSSNTSTSDTSSSVSNTSNTGSSDTGASNTSSSNTSESKTESSNTNTTNTSASNTSTSETSASNTSASCETASPPDFGPEVVFLGSIQSKSQTDSEILKIIQGGDGDGSPVYFFLVKTQPIISQLIRQREHPNGDISEETIISRRDTPDSYPTIQISKKFIPAGEEE